MTYNARITEVPTSLPRPALTIAQIYKARWQVESFFKWIKQHLRIKAFYGTSENAVKTQIWAITYLTYQTEVQSAERVGEENAPLPVCLSENLHRLVDLCGGH